MTESWGNVIKINGPHSQISYVLFLRITKSEKSMLNSWNVFKSKVCLYLHWYYSTVELTKMQ